MDFMETMGLLAFCSTLGLYGTSLPLFPLLLTSRRPDRVQFSSLILKLLNNVFSFHYAVIASIGVSRLSNGIGIFLHSLLSFAYLRVVPSKSLPSAFLLLGLIFYAAVAYYSRTMSHLEQIASMGLTSSTVRTLAYASPALTVFHAARTGNVDAVSLPLVCGAFVCNVTWYVYGGLLDDLYVKLPNVPGIVVQLAAFYLLWKRREKERRVTKEEKAEDRVDSDKTGVAKKVD